jgi:MFS family permease
MTLLSLGRLASGIGAAFAFIAGSTVSTSLAGGSPGRRATLIGLFYVGPGLGMALSGATAPFVLAHFGAGSWRIAWGWLTAVACLLAAPTFIATRGEFHSPAPARRAHSVRASSMAALLLGCALFAAGSIAYMTFVLAWVHAAGGDYAVQAEFWTTIGIAAIASPWLWARLTQRLDGGRPTAFLIGVSGIGAALPLLLGASAATLLESALLFGSAVFAAVAATTVYVRRNLPPESWPTAITMLTVAYGVGQTIGPAAMGYVSDWSGGGLESGLWASMSFLALGLISCAWQQDASPIG